MSNTISENYNAEKFTEYCNKNEYSLILATTDKPVVYKDEKKGIKVWLKSINKLFKNYKDKKTDIVHIWVIYPDKGETLRKAFLEAKQMCGEDSFAFKSWEDFLKNNLVVFSPYRDGKKIPKKKNGKEKNYKISHSKILKSDLPKNWKNLELDPSFTTSNFLVGVANSSKGIDIHYGLYPNETNETDEVYKFIKGSAGKKYDQAFKYIYLAAMEYLQKVRGKGKETNAHVLAEAKLDGWKFLTVDEFIGHYEKSMAA